MRSQTFYFLLFAFLSFSSANAQLLESDEIIKLNNTEDQSFVTSFLSQKGFIKGRKQQLPGNENNESWTFWITPKPELNGIGSVLIKTLDSSKASRSILILYNPFHYKMFVDQLLKKNYKFTGIEIVEQRSFLVFAKGNAIFKTIADENRNLNQTFFEIIFTTK